MKQLQAAELLDLWEQGLNLSSLQKAFIVLLAAFPELEPEAIAELSIGSRDSRLLEVRAHLFGPVLVNIASCPQCSCRIEWQQTIAELMVNKSNSQISSAYSLDTDGYQLSFRLPNSLDMAELGACHPDMAEQQLLQRCILSAEHVGNCCDIGQLPEPVLLALTQRIEELDPQAEIRINLACPECAHQWDVFFDIASFFWTELNEWAQRTLQIVHKLAKAYGWTEPEILKLSPVRRQLYLGMVGS